MQNSLRVSCANDWQDLSDVPSQVVIKSQSHIDINLCIQVLFQPPLCIVIPNIFSLELTIFSLKL